MEKILIRGADILTMDEKTGLIRGGDVAVENGVIKGAGPSGWAGNWAADKIIDAAGKAVLPGLVNTHTHAAMTLLRSYADDLQLMDWLENKIWPAEAKLTAEDVYWGTMLANLEMIKSGTTTFADMYFFMPEVAKAVEECGLRAVLSRGMVGVAPNATQALAESRSFIETWHNQAGGRITVQLGPHAPYTCPPDYLAKVMELATAYKVGIHIHLAETRHEVETCLKDYGKTPIKLMHDLGLFKHQVLAAHCVHLSDEEIDILAANKAGIAHNPGSNMKLASGVAPVARLLAKGVTVGLGTDGAASNNNLDMMEEVRLAALLQKVHTADPTLIPAMQALQMATVLGAKALGLHEQIGTLAPGKRADLIIFNLKAPHLTPKHDLASLLVYAASAADIETVMIDGKIVMENRQLLTLDEEKIMWHAQKCAARLTT
ncbi:MAG: amidohydrolase [Bacillota bacterium]|nr:N-ethylammeline chlorohydrolase [Bacillota bacterium]